MADFFLVCFQHSHRVEDPLGHRVPGRLRVRVKISKPFKPRLWRTGDLQCEEPPPEFERSEFGSLQSR